MSKIIAQPEVNRMSTDIPLTTFFKEAVDGSRINFDSDLRSESKLPYMIPEDQRYPEWSDDDINQLYNSVFRNFPINGIQLIQTCIDGKVVNLIIDGQSRLSYLDRFKKNERPYVTESGEQIYYRDLREDQKQHFLGYLLRAEIISECSESTQHDMLERLQNGKKMHDKDKLWNRRHSARVTFAINLTTSQNWKAKYMGTTKPIGDKNRTCLPKVVSFVNAILTYHSQGNPKPTNHKSFATSFDDLRERLDHAILPEDKQRISDFLDHLNHIIDHVYEIAKKGEPVSNWLNLSKQTGPILYEWLNTDKPEQHQINKKKWIHLLKVERSAKNFMFKGTKTMWNGLTSAETRNTEDHAIEARLKRINEYWKDPEGTAQKYSIEIDN